MCTATAFSAKNAKNKNNNNNKKFLFLTHEAIAETYFWKQSHQRKPAHEPSSEAINRQDF